MSINVRVLSLALIASLGFAARGAAPALTKIEVSPPEVNLLSARGKQLFVVQATYGDGITRDVTTQAKASIADSKLAKLKKNVILPVGDGETKLTVEFGGKSVSVPVKVKD